MRTLLAVVALSVALSAQVMNSGPLQRPETLDRDLYPADADAKADIRDALAKAAKEKKHVIVEFGAIWCLDCHILDHAFKTPGTKDLLDANYVVVHVDVGRYDKNLDIAKQYKVPLEKGIPAMAVLNAQGKVLVSNQAGEFQAARKMKMEEVVAFLNEWRPRAPKPAPAPRPEVKTSTSTGR
jgi:thioredoxin 1